MFSNLLTTTLALCITVLIEVLKTFIETDVSTFFILLSLIVDLNVQFFLNRKLVEYTQLKLFISYRVLF